MGAELLDRDIPWTNDEGVLVCTTRPDMDGTRFQTIDVLSSAEATPEGEGDTNVFIRIANEDESLRLTHHQTKALRDQLDLYIDEMPLNPV